MNQADIAVKDKAMIRLVDLIKNASENRCLLTNEYSLLEGVLFIETHGLHNVRYFSPYNNHQSISEQSCTEYFDSSNLSEDKNIQRLATLLCSLFPSDLGTISIKNGQTKNNFCSFLSSIKNSSFQRDDIKILAAALFCTCNANCYQSEIILNNSEFILRIKSTCFVNSSYSVNIKLNDPLIGDEYKLVIESLRTMLNIDVKNDILSSDLIIKSFIAYYLNASDLGQFYGQYREILEFFGTKPKIGEHLTLINFQLEKNLSTFCSLFQFPYEKSCELPYAFVPVDKQIQQHLKKSIGYWNCVENSLYHFMNSILWDGDNDEYLKINSKVPCVIDQIFNGKMRGIPDKDTLEFWHKLIQDLPFGFCCHQKLEYKKLIYSYEESIEKVFYVQKVNLIEFENGKKQYNFEIETGFINFIKLIEVITSKKGILIDALGPSLVKDKSGAVVDIELSIFEACFYQIIEILVGSQNSQYYQFELKNAYYSCEYGRKDVYGQLWIRRKYPKKGATVEFMLSHDPGHAFVTVTVIDAPFVQIESPSEEMDEWLKENRPVLGFLIKSYINYFLNKQNNNSIECCLLDYLKEEKIHEIMTGFRLEANHQTNMLLSKLINQYVLNESDKSKTNSLFKQRVKNFCLNVLNRLPIFDPKTLKLFVYPVYTMRDLLQIDPIILDEIEELDDFMPYSFSYRIHSDNILTDSIKKVDDFFQNKFDIENVKLEITYTQNECSKLKKFFESKSSLIIKNFESYSKMASISLFELRDTLDNIVCFILMYGSFFIFDETSSTKKLHVLDYYVLMNMIFSKHLKREVIIEYVNFFIKKLKVEKFENILAIAELIEHIGKKKFSKCIQVIKNKILDYSTGIEIILSCQLNEKEDKLRACLLEACDDNEKKNYVEILISKRQEMILNEMSKISL